MGLTSTLHLKSALEKVKQYAGGHITALASAVTEAIEEMEGLKADKPEYVTFVIPVTGWQTDNTVPGYPHYIDIPVAGLTAADSVAVDVAPASTAVARAADFTATQSIAGAVRLRAASVPSAEISAQYHIAPAAKEVTQ